jgi:hypothetical protein
MLKKLAIVSLIGLSLVSINQIGFSKQQLTDAQIKQKLIQESIDEYPGNCPCPYNTARNGSSCGARSAYSREGGYAPLCYPKDITPQMVKEYRSNH